MTKKGRRPDDGVVSELTGAEYNPRIISDWQLEALKKAMANFGDLSGIVFNRRTQRLVGGHQRVKSISPETPITIVQRFETPTRLGTVATGYVEAHGERWTYREVDWDETTEISANIAANQHGGDWDLAKLSPLLSDLDAHGTDMSITGFTDKELEGLLVFDGSHPDGDGDGSGALGGIEYQVVVTCDGEAAQAQLCQELEARGLKCRLLTL